jgi:hypothetical protein
MSGRSFGCPTRCGKAAKTREVALEAAGWAVVGYSRAQALAEKAVLPVDFGAIDGEAEWLDEERRRLGPHRISGSPEFARPVLFTALRTGFAHDLLRRACDATRDLHTAMGLGRTIRSRSRTAHGRSGRVTVGSTAAIGGGTTIAPWSRGLGMGFTGARHRSGHDGCPQHHGILRGWHGMLRGTNRSGPA